MRLMGLMPIYQKPASAERFAALGSSGHIRVRGQLGFPFRAFSDSESQTGGLNGRAAVCSFG